MAGLDPAIHALFSLSKRRGLRGSNPRMTQWDVRFGPILSPIVIASEAKQSRSNTRIKQGWISFVACAPRNDGDNLQR